MGFSFETGISSLAVFLQGLLSFFSPCVLPLVPLYLGYLASGLRLDMNNGENPADDESSMRNGRLHLFIRVFCFSLGISGAFFILGLGATAAGSFFKEWKYIIIRAGAVLIILFGLYQTGIFGKSKLFSRERRISLPFEKMTMSPLTAFLMGFTFSFAWTPCVGPALTSVLLMTGSAQTGAKGFLLIGVYTAGFILPFLACGVFTARLLGFFRKHSGIVRYTVKLGGVILIFMGFLMFTGKMNDITGYLSGVTQQEEDAGSGDKNSSAGENQSEKADNGGKKNEESESGKKSPAYAFELKDQYGNLHTLDQYKGKVIFLNFWATWCGPCRNEMPDIQKLYEEYAAMGEEADVVILGAAAPGLGNESSAEEISSFMKDNGYTYPVLMDQTAGMFQWYGISAFPTTFMIDPEGNIFGYVSGQMTEDIMRSIISQTLEGKK